MKLSYTTMATPGRGILESAKLARKYGYKGIDIRISDYLGECTLNDSCSKILEVKEMLASEGIILSSLLCYNKSGGKDDSSWHEMNESLKKHLELAYELEAPAVRIFAGNPLEFENSLDFKKRTADVISRVLEYDKSNVNILLQNHLNGFKAGEAVELAEMVGKSRFGIAFSPDHCVLQEENANKLYSSIKKYSRQMYVADLIGTNSDYKCVFPGRGIVPIKEALMELGGTTFEGWITFKWEKIWHPDLERAEIVLPLFMEFINRIIKK